MTNAEKLATPKRRVIFFRDGGFYPLEIPEGTIADNAECNPGTLRVEDAVTGEILWQNVKGHAPAAGGEPSTRAKGCNHHEKLNSERAAGCCAPPCSPL